MSWGGEFIVLYATTKRFNLGLLFIRLEIVRCSD